MQSELDNFHHQLELTTQVRQGSIGSIVRDLPKGTILKVNGRIVLHKF